MKHLPLSLFITLAVNAVAAAGQVANWKDFNPAAGHPSLSAGGDTDGPTFGNGTNASAQASWIAGRFGTAASPESVTLAVGQTLTVSGSYVLTGGAGADSDYRHGIFNDGGQFAANDGSLWTGGWLHQSGTNLFQGRTNGPFISSAADAVALATTKSSTGTLIKDSATALTFSMSITRDSPTTVDIVSSFTGGGGGLDQVYSANDVATSLFTYTAVGLLFGGGSSVDQVVFSAVQYTVTPDPTELEITRIVREESIDPANVIVTISFTSDENKTYTIYRSADLSTPVENRTDVDDSVPGETGSDTTTFPIDFNFYGIPLDTPEQFFVVKENPPTNP